VRNGVDTVKSHKAAQGLSADDAARVAEVTAAMVLLSHARAALYPYTRPLFAAVGAGAVALADGSVLDVPSRAGPPTREAAAEPSQFSRVQAQVAYVPSLIVGGAGVLATLRRYRGLVWLSHGYERWAWKAAFGSLSASACLGILDAGSKHDRAHNLLAPGAGALLAVVAGERLGSTVGRVLFPSLTALGVVSAAAALQDDPHGARASAVLQVASLILLPSLHACLPTYTLSSQGLLGLVWLGMAAFASTQDETRLGEPLFLAVGAASILRTVVLRAPICQF
jgi:hypothetical protein